MDTLELIILVAAIAYLFGMIHMAKIIFGRNRREPPDRHDHYHF